MPNTERLSKVAEEARSDEVAEPAKPVEKDQVEDWGKTQIARANHDAKTPEAARVEAAKEGDGKRRMGAEAKKGGLGKGGNPEEDWHRSQLEGLAEGWPDGARLYWHIR